MGIGNLLVGDVEQLLTTRVLRRQALFRMRGQASQCWRAETSLEQMYPGMRCLLLPSATIGLALILEALEIPRGREVLISPFGWLSNWSCITRAGLVPRFVPLDADLQLRPEQIAARIGENTAAVIVTHLMGRGQQAVPEIAAICEARGIPLLEDVAQSFGVSVGGQRAGTFGTAAWSSLNHHKVLSTGDGGFVFVRDALYDRICALHDQGCVLREGKRRPAGELAPGLSLRVSEIVAAVLRAQLARYPLMRARIRTMHRAVSAACESGLGLELIAAAEGDLPFTVLFRKRAGSNSDYPSLAESGWHVAANVPWLEDGFAAADDDELPRTVGRLQQVCAVGSGFVDPFYATPLGLSVTDPLSEVEPLVQMLEKRI